MSGRENKPHIAIFGACNAGKSTLLNFLTDARVSIVSPQVGTTTDIVRKSYEIIGFAPVIFLDTAGLDDRSELGALRVHRSMEVLSAVDLVLLVYRVWGDCEQNFMELLDRERVPFVAIRNRFADEPVCAELPATHLGVDLSAVDTLWRDTLLDRIKTSLPEQSYTAVSMFGGRVGRGDTVVLVCPIDSEAPAGRIILPQVQALRELLDRNAIAIAIQPQQVGDLLNSGVKPTLVVTDSQVYAQVRKMVPPQIELTSFSILLAAAKGDPQLYAKGLERIDTLEDGDRILISESCSHQVSCEDIGRVKIPRWLEAHSGRKLQFTFISAPDPLPCDLGSYALMVQCGGCMVTRRALLNRVRQAAAAQVAVTNYGMLIKKITLK